MPRLSKSTLNKFPWSPLSVLIKSNKEYCFLMLAKDILVSKIWFNIRLVLIQKIGRNFLLLLSSIDAQMKCENIVDCNQLSSLRPTTRKVP